MQLRIIKLSISPFEVKVITIYRKTTWEKVGKLALVKMHIPAERRNGVSLEEGGDRTHARGWRCAPLAGAGLCCAVLLCVCRSYSQG